MKTKKEIFATGLVAISLVIGIAVACSDDNINTDNTIPQASAKSGEALVPWPEAVMNFLNACNHVYRTNPSALRTACMDNDYEAFFALTGITEEMRTAMVSQTEAFMRGVLAIHPEYQSSDNEGCHCSTNNLATLYETAVDIHRAYEDLGITDSMIVRSDPTDMSPELIACLLDCENRFGHGFVDPDSLAVCNANCYYLEMLRNLEPGQEPPFGGGPLEP